MNKQPSPSSNTSAESKNYLIPLPNQYKKSEVMWPLSISPMEQKMSSQEHKFPQENIQSSNSIKDQSYMVNFPKSDSPGSIEFRKKKVF